ncbi:hypothetical protein [Pelomonas sp. Root1237]|uniref:hypothetical protein n=1 Tax=Pelomonas sp. Root1237 TaxID=1736434 RepID=UPI000700A2DB|nr:hypothetical protein [Pelomonas sp. Root1237]KQV96631.1 hypothetical protein ASC91_03575 [Pelomonas sp. Root1237]
MTVPASVAAFLAKQRDLLDRLEQFAKTPEYCRLLTAAAPLIEGDLDPWLAEWLIQPVVRLDEQPNDEAIRHGEPPIHTVCRQGGVDLIEQQIARIAALASYWADA